MNNENPNTQGYTPRPGSKVELALQALQDGPMTTHAMARVMSCELKAVHSMLNVAINHGCVVQKKDGSGLVHFALPDHIDGGFTLVDQEAAAATQDAKGRTKVNPDDPFGLVAKRAAGDMTPLPVSTTAATAAGGGNAVKRAYTPRPGSDGTKAIEALLDGPMSAKAMMVELNCDHHSVNARLSKVVKAGLVIKVEDEAGVFHYALPGMEIDKRFTPYGGRGNPVAKSEVAGATPKHDFPSTEQHAAALFASSSQPSAEALANRVAFGDAARALLAGEQAARADGDVFTAGLMASGELTISVGAVRVSLNAERQQQLFGLLSRVKW